MRAIKYLVVHCTATPIDTKVESIQRYWQNNLKWKNPGYHYIIEYDGTIVQLQPESKPSNGVKHHNANSLHLSYIGGIDEDGSPKDTRSEAQQLSMLKLLLVLKTSYPGAIVLGHRDFSGVAKACPSFDVSEWLEVSITNKI